MNGQTLDQLNVDNFNSGNAPKKCQEICGVDIVELHTPGRDGPINL